MDFITREQARRDIVALSLPPIVLDVFDEKPLPENLDLQFREPHEIFSLNAAGQAVYGQGRITPLWMNCYTIVAYHHEASRRGFFRFDIESPESVEESTSLNWQQVLVKEFQLLWETETSPESMIEIAKLFQFKHVELLMLELSEGDLSTYEKSDVWYQTFLSKICD